MADLILDFVVNGDRRKALCPASRSLLDLLRDDLGLTGSKHGCDVGDCGACTVLIDGVPALSCITLAAEVQGQSVTTVEGVGRVGALHPVQAAFDRHVAAQCGYCTPGFIVALTHLFADTPDPSDEAIRVCLGSNICRCTGYTKIIAAAVEAREVINGRRQP